MLLPALRVIARSAIVTSDSHSARTSGPRVYGRRADWPVLQWAMALIGLGI